jgi:hypothetical protein
MKKLNLIAIAAAAILLAACIPSVYPFYTDKDVIVDQRLFGTWQEEKSNDPEIWKFERATNNSIQLTVVEEKKTNDLVAHLFKLKQEQFLDLIADPDFLTNQTPVAAVSMIPGHLLMHVSQIEPTLQMSFCNVDWLEKYLEKNPNALAHRSEDGAIILTADTSALQNFVLQHLGTNELFKTNEYIAGELVRVTNASNSASPK